MPTSPSFDELFHRPLPSTVPTIAEGDPEKDIGAGLAMSGGGYRAMLFHLGGLRRLYEVGALQGLERISSVSGGSITNAHLALAWDKLFDGDIDVSRFDQFVTVPVMSRADVLLDVPGGLRGILRPKRSIAETVARTYDKWFDGATLQDLPDHPRFVFCATNLGTGAVVRFAKPYVADYKVGVRHHSRLKLGDIVAASAAFPPVLSPMTMKLGPNDDLSETFDDEEAPELHSTSYGRRLQLSDGGVYDNLGLQPISKFCTQLISDGGGPFTYDDDVPSNWVQHMIRAWQTTDNQVRSLRRSELIHEFRRGSLHGTYWGIATEYSEYERGTIPVDDSWTGYLKSIATRLAPIDDARKKQLVNFSYCLCDAAMERYLVKAPVNPAPSLPFPDQPLSGHAPEIEDKPFWKFWRA